MHGRFNIKVTPTTAKRDSNFNSQMAITWHLNFQKIPWVPKSYSGKLAQLLAQAVPQK